MYNGQWFSLSETVHELKYKGDVPAPGRDVAKRLSYSGVEGSGHDGFPNFPDNFPNYLSCNEMNWLAFKNYIVFVNLYIHKVSHS